ncbi:hypothetical protein ACFFJT_00315 [Dyella flava]|uniref:Uncharacterized protein n=1 Tax=Dyella flava TaxID=1920170 RepID=A0ABS2JYZ2_9GAMM|nr:hypothetical protein [Dyella flava]MBM7124236.1 hypothetical protein [Dyella flava]
MPKFDMMNPFVTHIGGGVFVCPPGVRQGGLLGSRCLRWRDHSGFGRNEDEVT